MEPSSIPPTLNSLLPTDVWSVILDFTAVSDLASLISTCKGIKAVVDQDSVYERLARRKFPSPLLDVSLYDSSWKELLKDDNAKNGYYLLQVHCLTEWKYYKLNGLFYVNSLRSIAWDRLTNQIMVEIEAFGEYDLRQARSTSIFRVNPIPVPPRAVRLRPITVQEYDTGSPYHQLCRQYYNSSDFWPGHSFKFTYNGSWSIRGSDYPCVKFLSKQDFGSLRQLFALSKDNKCQFVSRTAPLKPSNVLQWNTTLPQSVLERHEQGAWGAVRTAVPSEAGQEQQE